MKQKFEFFFLFENPFKNITNRIEMISMNVKIIGDFVATKKTTTTTKYK